MLGQWVESSMLDDIFPRVQSDLFKVRIDLDVLGSQCQVFSFLMSPICKLNSCELRVLRVPLLIMPCGKDGP